MNTLKEKPVTDMPHTVYLGLGSNLGDRLSMIQKALLMLADDDHIKISGVSSAYESKPLGGKTDLPFINIAAEIETDLSPENLLQHCRFIETACGRQVRNKWEAREIDIDILLVGESQYNSDTLQIPHPAIVERDFVLMPLLELNSLLILPQTGKRLSDYAELVTEKYITSVSAVNFNLHKGETAFHE